MNDFSDSGSDVDPLDESFDQATNHMERIRSQLSLNDLLELYALFKQVTVGECTTPKPGVFEIKSQAKWNAWKSLGSMNATEAKRRYIKKVEQLDVNWCEEKKSSEKEASSFSTWVVHSIELKPDDIEQKPEHEKTIFDYVKDGNLMRLKELLKSNTHQQLEQLDENGMGLIHWAADRNSLEILQFLIASGVDVNLRDAEQQTALHYAASCGHVGSLKILLNSNADRSVKDSDGQTCFDVAEDSEIKTILEA